MDQRTKDSVIVIIPLVILLVTVGFLTEYNILYTTLAGIIGGLLGLLISKLVKRQKW